MKYLNLLIFLLIPVSVCAEVIDADSLFKEIDESISGVIIKGRSTTITPKDEYNKLAAIRRERSRDSQEKQKQRANAMLRRMVDKQVKKIMQDPTEIANIDTDKFTNMMSVGNNFVDPDVMFPLADEDVIRIRDFETRFVNGETLVYNEMYTDSAGAGKVKNMITRFASINLHRATMDIFITIPKNSTYDGEPGSYITKEVTPKTMPSNNHIGARAYGRGLSFYTITGMEKTKDFDSVNGDFYTVSVTGGIEFQTGKITVDKSKGYCWTQKLFYNHEGLYTESLATDYRQVDGLWFPFHVETTMYLPENEWSDDNKIRRKTITEISSVEIDQQMVFSEETMLEEEMEIVNTTQSSSFSGIISTTYYMKPKQ